MVMEDARFLIGLVLFVVIVLSIRIQSIGRDVKDIKVFLQELTITGNSNCRNNSEAKRVEVDHRDPNTLG